MARAARRRQRRARISAATLSSQKQEVSPSLDRDAYLSAEISASEEVADVSIPLQVPAGGDSEAEPSYECGVCLCPDIPASEVVAKPCHCAISYCKECWDLTMCTTGPRCPSCRASIGFDYDSELCEAKFLLYDEPESASNGMIVLPQTYKSGTQIIGQTRWFLVQAMQERMQPSLKKILRCQTATGAGPCVCGGKNCFRRMTMEERRSKARSPATFAPSCDCCDKKLYKPGCVEEGQSVVIGTHIWSCDRVSVAHMCGIDVCDDCMSGFLHAP